MRLVRASLVVILGAASNAYAQQTQWGQCGGIAWTGATTCVSGWTCVFSNPCNELFGYSQCLPGGASSTSTSKLTSNDIRTSTSSRTPTTAATTYRTTASTTAVTTRSSTKISSTFISSTTTTKATSSASGNYPGPTLLSGYYWIRAVAAPHFHEYLQAPAPTAIIASHTTAGQFQIIAGQLVQTTASGLLYANVEQRSDTTDMLLGVTFKTTQNAFGAFSWSGDALQWNVASITRPNSSAWYVCGTDNQLFINLGQYLYGTPAGCADQTIHFYNGATADL